jgi:integrase
MPNKSPTTKVLLERALVVYRRERSKVWQCRFKVDGKWQRASTKERDLAKAKAAADALRITAEIRKRDNLPVITRKLRDIGKLAIARMKDEQANGAGKAIYGDYIACITDYLIPILGKRLITRIDYAALNELDAKRIEMMGKAPTQSTMLTHNAALNKVFDEAVRRNYLAEASKPKLEAKGKKSERRAAFELDEVKALIGGFEGWIERARDEEQKGARLLLRYYVDALLDTGARPGKELLQLKWKQIEYSNKATVTATGEEDEDGEQILAHNLNRAVAMQVTGKTGTRTMLGMERTVNALREIAKRNYPSIRMSPTAPLEDVIRRSNADYVFRVVREGAQVDISSSLANMFESYLKEHNLLIDAKTEQKRVFYSLRHTYATLALTHDKVPIHTLAKQMGTSVVMIEKHYSHLKVVQAIEQLRGEESRQLINAGGVIDAAYASTKVAKVKKGAKAKAAAKK